MMTQFKILVVSVFAIAIAFGSARVDAQKSVKTATVKSVSDVKQTIKKPATVYANKTADLYSKVGGYIKIVNKDIGDSVTTKDTLVELDIPETEQKLLQKKAMIKKAKAELEQAKAALVQSERAVDAAKAGVEEANSLSAQKKAQLKLASTNYDRIAQLVSKGAVNQDRLDTATFEKNSAQAGVDSVKAKVATATAKLASAEAAKAKADADIKSAQANVEVANADFKFAEKMAEYAKIKPPFDGKITKRWFDEGAFVQSADGNSAAKPIFQIVQMSKVRIVFSISSSEIANLNLKDPVVFSGQQGSGVGQISGEVSRFSAGLDTGTRMLRVEMDVDNQDNKLMPGQFGNVTVTLEVLKSALSVPRSAVVDGQVFVIRNGRARAVKVDVAFIDKSNAIIRSGLSAGQQVIVAARSISDGDAVTTK